MKFDREIVRRPFQKFKVAPKSVPIPYEERIALHLHRRPRWHADPLTQPLSNP